MRQSTSKPNVVTFTTLIRAVGSSGDVETAQCLVFLAHARDDGAFDEALFLEAMETCAKRKDRDVATRLLYEIATHAPKLREEDRLFVTLGQVAKLAVDDGAKPVLDEWAESGVLSLEECERVVRLQQDKSSTACDKSKMLGCLGHQTAQSVRKAVVQHDINRLISRIQNGSIVTVYVIRRCRCFGQAC